MLEEFVGEGLRGLARGKKRLDVVHYEIVGKTGEAMIVGVKRTWEKKAVMVKRDVATGSRRFAFTRHKSWTQRFLHAN